MNEAPAVAEETYPKDMVNAERWLNWEYQDGRKVPVAPHTGSALSGVDPHDSDNWADFETAKAAVEEWREFNIRLGLAYDLPREGAERCLIDFDDCRDPTTGEIIPTVRELVETADSAAFVSQSGTGVHIYGKARLPDGVKTIEDDLPNGAEIEVYDRSRFIGVTGKHIDGTPEYCTDIQATVDDLAARFDTTAETGGDGPAEEPALDAVDLEGLEETDDVQDIIDAIALTKPRDIRLRSTVTGERSDGSKSLDPSWAHSESGTRLAQFDDGWAYRDGMYGLDALQVVALEEGIITDPGTYPEGETFWKAVGALRDRGAPIPRYTGDDRTHPDALGVYEEPDDKEEEMRQFLIEMELEG